MRFELYIKHGETWVLTECGLDREAAIRLIMSLEALGHRTKIELT